MYVTDVKAVNKVLKEATQRAIQDLFDQGKPVTFLKGEYIVRMYSDGSYDILKKLEKPYVKPEKLVYHLEQNLDDRSDS
jgi:hypothetical protein